jgi:haloacetate dehalogenase
MFDGFQLDRFAVVGHDRGSYVAYRTALDHPDRVSKLVVMDGVPVVEALERCTDKFAAMWWHWWFFAQTAKPAERVICADPETWYNAWTSNGPDQLGPENHADFLAAIRNPATASTPPTTSRRTPRKTSSEVSGASSVSGRRPSPVGPWTSSSGP